MPQVALPPEWALQSGVMLTWPHCDSYWGDTLEDIDAVFVNVAKAVIKRQKLVITCLDEQHEQHISALLKKAQVNMAQVRFFHAPLNDIWVRDHGPITVLQDNKPVLLDFTFNGWGGKYPAENDNKISRQLHTQQCFGHTPLKTIDMVLEGGGIEVDGHGTLLTTKSCLLAKTRNPHMTQQEIEARLKELFGLNRVLWLDHGDLHGDDTDGHVDTIARFVDAHTICYVTCSDPTDEHYETFQKMEQQLKTFKDYQGNPYKLVPLPWPQAKYADYDGRRLPATYANFLIINDAVLVPTYDDPADEEALRVLQKCFPDREIVAIPSMAVIQWYGSVHCMTMQLPHEVI